jgi:proline dehydrogenase
MLRSALLYLSGQQQIFRFVRNNKLAKTMANRFVAGETLDTALAAVARLNARRITASLDLLGESVHNEEEARASGEGYVTMLDRIYERKADANVSVKLTAMGLDISEDLCVAIMHKILQRARDYQTFVRIDMESSEYTQRTLDLFEHRLYPAYRENVGIVLQSYLYRTFATVAYPNKKDVDSNYVRCMHELMLKGNYPGIATHDEAIIKDAKRFAKENQIATSRFEFQMLYGVRRDLQDQLVREGYRMRVYVPFGTQWYPYLMRRLAERPANVAFLTGSVFKEMVGRRR